MRDAAASDEAALVALGLATGLFTLEEADALLRDSLRSVVAPDAAAPPPLAHARVVDGADGAPVGWTLLQGEPSPDGAGAPPTWELMWIGTSRAAEGTGVGRALLADAEALAARAGAARLLISTSATPTTARARGFYDRNGYAVVSTDKDYYGAGDDRVLFARGLAPAAAVAARAV